VWVGIRGLAVVLAGLVAALCVIIVGNQLLLRTTIGSVPWHSSPQYTVAGLSVEALKVLISAAVGGFAASWLARGSSMWPAVAVGACLLGLAVSQGIPSSELQPIWYSVVSMVLLLPVALLGGRVARGRHGV
jgi:hypothetical protein